MVYFEPWQVMTLYSQQLGNISYDMLWMIVAIVFAQVLSVDIDMVDICQHVRVPAHQVGVVEVFRRIIANVDIATVMTQSVD
jgi:hypothetical protein